MTDYSHEARQDPVQADDDTDQQITNMLRAVMFANDPNRAALYAEMKRNPAFIRRVAATYPETETGKKARQIIELLTQQFKGYKTNRLKLLKEQMRVTRK